MSLSARSGKILAATFERRLANYMMTEVPGAGDIMLQIADSGPTARP